VRGRALTRRSEQAVEPPTSGEPDERLRLPVPPLPCLRVVLRKLLTGAALAWLLASAATAAGAPEGARTSSQVSQTASLLMPGVTYAREVDFTPRGPVVLDVVTAPRPDGALYTLAPVLSNETIGGAETLTAMESRLSGSATVVGVNGDYASAKTGAPSGILIRGGVLDSAPAPARSSLGIAGDGTLSVARVAYKGTWQGSGQRRPLDLNAAPAKGHATLYTPAWGAATPAESGVVEAVLSSFPATRAGQPLDAPVTQVIGNGGTPIPPGGAVLVGRNAQAGYLTTEAPIGRQIEVRLTLTPDWSGLTSAVGGGPLLVSGGKPVFNAGESFGAPILNDRNARSAVGQLSDGRILLVTTEGVSPAYSVGMTNYELGVALARLGAVTAIGLGSGASAAMAFDGTLLTRPSATTEKPLADALVLSYSGVYAAPPGAAVLSPNGDGVDDTQALAYKLVRPSHVTATVTGPDGTTATLADDDEQPGVHTLTWNGQNAAGTTAAEGAWRFAVTATDDRGVTTTAERAFSLDDTLGALSVGPAGGTNVGGVPAVAAATFQLTRPASVVVTVQRHNGVVVATLERATLQPGPQRVLWDGVGIGGKPARSGGYDVHVDATSSVGTVSLVAPFTLPFGTMRS
jgi:flagellar hook assembly protein FlgD